MKQYKKNKRLCFIFNIGPHYRFPIFKAIDDRFMSSFYFGDHMRLPIKTFDYNNETIEVKQYLPIDDKLDLIATVINNSHDAQKEFSNAVKIEVYLTLEIIRKYTNITFTDKQLENPSKLYDLVISSGFMSKLMDYLPINEYSILLAEINKMVDSIYAYQNSTVGIMDTISQDYSQLNLDANEIQKKKKKGKTNYK